jgi:hypothetical protein
MELVCIFNNACREDKNFIKVKRWIREKKIEKIQNRKIFLNEKKNYFSG